MFFDLFIKSGGAVSAMETAASALGSSGALAALSEHGHTRSFIIQGRPATIESVAFAKHWNDGYQEALKDIYHFRERYIDQPRSDSVKANFAVARRLFETGAISVEEYEELTGRKPSPAK